MGGEPRCAGSRNDCCPAQFLHLRREIWVVLSSVHTPDRTYRHAIHMDREAHRPNLYCLRRVHFLGVRPQIDLPLRLGSPKCLLIGWYPLSPIHPETIHLRPERLSCPVEFSGVVMVGFPNLKNEPAYPHIGLCVSPSPSFYAPIVFNNVLLPCRPACWRFKYLLGVGQGPALSSGIILFHDGLPLIR